MIVYRELSSLERDLGISAKTLYAVSNNLVKHYHKAKLPKKAAEACECECAEAPVEECECECTEAPVEA